MSQEQGAQLLYAVDRLEALQTAQGMIAGEAHQSLIVVVMLLLCVVFLLGYRSQK